MANVLDKYRSNRNFLQVSSQASFAVKRLPDVQFFTQGYTIPGVKLNVVVQPTPYVDIKHSGDALAFNEMRVKFKIDEYLYNYSSIFDWMVALGFPDSHEQYKKLYDQPLWSGDGLYSDITLLINGSKGTPKVEFTFKDAFPVALTDIDFKTTTTGVEYVTAEAAFAYTLYDIRRLNSDVLPT